jgi:hypothetical protein
MANNEYSINSILKLGGGKTHYFYINNFDKFNESNTEDNFLHINFINIHILKKAFKDILKISQKSKEYKEGYNTITFELPAFILNKQGRELFNGKLKAKLVHYYYKDNFNNDKITLSFEINNIILTTTYTGIKYINNNLHANIFPGIKYNLKSIKALEKKKKSYI